jgi:RNA polymerase sigma-70 factor (ECF subfamily)
MRPLRELDPDALPDHIDALFRAAWAICGSREDAEDLVQDTFARVLKRPRLLRRDDDLGYLLQALRNTHASHYRQRSRRRHDVPLADADPPDARQRDPAETVLANDVMAAIADAPRPYRDALIAVDVLGLSYRQAANRLRTREGTVMSRLFRGRRHVALALTEAGVTT